MDVSLSLMVLIFNLSESLFNHLFEFSDELEFLSSGLGGIMVFVIEGSTESLSLVPKLLVSLELVAGSLRDSGLGSNALVEFVNFFSESFRLSSKSLEVGLESFLLVVEGLDGFSIEFSEIFISLLKVLSQGLEELSDSFKGSVIKATFVEGQLSEGSEDGSIVSVVVLVGGLLDHLLGDLGEFNKTSTSLEDGSEDILSLFNGVKSISVVLRSSASKGGLSISHGEDDS